MEEIDYKELYFHAMHEMERAIRILTEAQKTCEELYLKLSDEEKKTL